MGFLRSSLVILAAFTCLINSLTINDNGEILTATYSCNNWERVFLNKKQSNLVPLFYYNKKVYFMAVHYPLRWIEALQFCKAMNMELLTIHSDDENERVFKYIRDASKGTEYWTGGTRLIDGNKWIWMPYIAEVNYTNWSLGQPDNINEKCLQLWIIGNKLQWNDRDCNALFPFICERYVNY